VEREDVLLCCEQRPPGRGAVAAARGRSTVPVGLMGRRHRGQRQSEVARGVLIAVFVVV
jgi:hypothetical protein